MPPAARSGLTDARKGLSHMASEFVRVKGPDGTEYTTSEKAAGVFGAKVIDKDAVDVNGRPLAPKYDIHKGGTKSAATQKDG